MRSCWSVAIFLFHRERIVAAMIVGQEEHKLRRCANVRRKGPLLQHPDEVRRIRLPKMGWIKIVRLHRSDQLAVGGGIQADAEEHHNIVLAVTQRQ